MKKTLLYFRNIFYAATGSKLRFILTWIGFTVGVFLIAAGAIILESYYTAKTKEIRLLPDGTFYVLGYNSSDAEVSKLLSAASVRPCMQLDAGGSGVITSFHLDDERTVIVTAKLMGLSAPTDVVAYFDYTYGSRLASLDIVEGRMLTNEEIKSNARSVVIDEFTAELVFGTASAAVGKRIAMNNNATVDYEIVEEGAEPEPLIYYTVVGVVKNNYYVESDKRDFISALKKRNGQRELNVSSTVYVPFGYEENFGRKTSFADSSCYFLYTSDDADIYQSMKATIGSLAASGRSSSISSVIDKELLYEEAVREIRPIRIGIYVAGAVLILIAGLFCMSILFFSMKERVTEVGVRKAYGASVLDIVVQFLLENILITIFSILTAVAAAILISMKTESYIIGNFLFDYEVIITELNIILPVLIGFLQCIVFTIIPCVRYSALNVTSALKFE